jgi:hypothetical protein
MSKIIINCIAETWLVIDKSTFTNKVINEQYHNFLFFGHHLDYMTTIGTFFNLERDYNVVFADSCIYSFESYVNGLLKCHHRSLEITSLLS